MKKVTFGESGLPGYVCGDVTSPAVIVIQVRGRRRSTAGREWRAAAGARGLRRHRLGALLAGALQGTAAGAASLGTL